MTYDVWITHYGIPPGKAWAEWKHTRLNRRPVSLRKAIEMAVGCPTWARVYERERPLESVYDNGRAPRAPEGWLEDASWEAQLPLNLARRLK